MAISASAVKELRERTGVGMMECKKALEANGGDMEAAADWLRKQGLAKAVKKEGRVTAEGRIALGQDGNEAVLVEINCETDFVAKDENFVGFCNAVAEAAGKAKTGDVDAIRTLPLAAGSVDEVRQALVAKIGENMQVRRAMHLGGGEHLATYLHGVKIGVLVAMDGGSLDLARDVAMHVAAMNPPFLDGSQIPAEVLDKEREILTAEAAGSGKKPEIIAKMVEGRVQKFMAENTLLGQPFVKDQDQTVEKVLKAAGAKVLAFRRLAVGEGVEKKEENFAEEVMKQVASAQN
jgi:elongation factor Ts